MKSSMIKLSIFAALSVVATTSAMAHIDYSELGTQHWLQHVSESGSTPSAKESARYGYQASAMPVREIKLTSNDRYLNVAQSETVRITLNGKSVIWTFDTLGSTPFSLAKIIPGAEQTTVFVAEDMRYQGG